MYGVVRFVDTQNAPRHIKVSNSTELNFGQDEGESPSPQAQR